MLVREEKSWEKESKKLKPPNGMYFRLEGRQVLVHGEGHVAEDGPAADIDAVESALPADRLSLH